MGQMMDSIKNYSYYTMPEENRIPYDKKSNNGYVFADKYIPEELILDILLLTDYKTLLNCQLVCKRWNILIQNYVWKKMAEKTLGRSVDRRAPWYMYYYICAKKLDVNLIKNHSGQEGLDQAWEIDEDGGDHWAVESPPVGVPELPLEGVQCCFVTSFTRCRKHQIINLKEKGINDIVLDVLQPPIEISEYYSCRWDCPAIYICTVELLTDTDIVLDSYNFSKTLEGEEQNQWYKFEHVFENYGTGLRKVRFSHGGKDRTFWAGHYGSKMARASVKLGIPKIDDTKIQNFNKVLHTAT